MFRLACAFTLPGLTIKNNCKIVGKRMLHYRSSKKRREAFPYHVPQGELSFPVLTNVPSLRDSLRDRGGHPGNDEYGAMPKGQSRIATRRVDFARRQELVLDTRRRQQKGSEYCKKARLTNRTGKTVESSPVQKSRNRETELIKSSESGKARLLSVEVRRRSATSHKKVQRLKGLGEDDHQLNKSAIPAGICGSRRKEISITKEFEAATQDFLFQSYFNVCKKSYNLRDESDKRLLDSLAERFFPGYSSSRRRMLSNLFTALEFASGAASMLGPFAHPSGFSRVLGNEGRKDGGDRVCGEDRGAGYARTDGRRARAGKDVQRRSRLSPRAKGQLHCDRRDDEVRVSDVGGLRGVP